MVENRIITESAKNIRTIARASLKGNWLTAALATLVYMLLILAPNLLISDILGWHKPAVDTILGIYSLVIAGPMTYGYVVFISNMFRKKSFGVGDVFDGFEHFGKTLGLYLYMMLFIFLWSLLLVVPGIIAAYRYSLAFYVLRDNPQIGIAQAIDISKQMMTGNKAKMFCLDLSFIGWILLASIPVSLYSSYMGITQGYDYVVQSETITTLLSLAYLWITPYMQSANYAFYEILNGNLRIRHEAPSFTVGDEGQSQYQANAGSGDDTTNNNANAEAKETTRPAAAAAPEENRQSAQPDAASDGKWAFHPVNPQTGEGFDEGKDKN